ncbi:DUF4440 domain-containing protein [Bacillus sp. ISL-37]|jgi:hypothetical protein|uniref:DUF4440 domain-containing protein n=1 Tax=Bacillus sp. ISL-37 TaxID=2819123 RepID=UPI001BEBAF1F|nr:DUF4440 domain-containing protein [Bacillus sp. ISL-37]MBT2683801.1 DUF4440 domain-containing protein [Bacillus sp. ISL-37]
MLNEGLNAVKDYRKLLNTGKVREINKWISDDFIGYFGYYEDREYEVYHGEQYRLDNIETFKMYEEKKPSWVYNDLTHSLREENELILSSIVDFYFSEQKVASALAVEVFRKENSGWKLFRQHMEKYGLLQQESK